MWKTHSTFEAVYSFVKKTRPEIDPNNGFRRQLKKFQQFKHYACNHSLICVILQSKYNISNYGNEYAAGLRPM